MTASPAIKLPTNAPSILPIHLTTTQVRPVAYRVLSKKHGLNLKSTGLDVLAKFLGHNFGADWRGAKAEKFLDQIAKIWKEQDRGLFVDGETLSIVIREATSAAEEIVNEDDGSMVQKKKVNQFDWQDYVKVVNAQTQPAFKYNSSRKQFEAAPAPEILGDAKSRAEVFVSRYNILYDRLLRDETFQPSSFGNVSTNSITMIKNMLGRNDQDFVLVGHISKGADGEWMLQDKSGKIQIDITTRAMPSPLSYYSPGNFVICTGVYHNNVFIVDACGPPPAERRHKTRQAYGYVDFLGVHSAMNSTAPGSKTSRVERIDRSFEEQLRMSEQQLNHQIVILGTDIHLDQLKVIDALRSVFGSLENEPPVAIIFPGSFTSVPFQPNGSSTNYKSSFDFLAQLLGDFPNICENSRLIFLPGDNDPWAATFTAGAAPAWPLSPIPSLFTNRVRRVAKHAVWASNPSRLSYLSQEITLVRDDYGARFHRNAIVFPREFDDEQDENQPPAEDMDAEKTHIEVDENDSSSDDDDVAANRRAIQQMVLESSQPPKEQKKNKAVSISPELFEARKVVRSILDQGHLSPFPLTTRPVYWQYDHALSLMPLPSMMVLADPTTPQFKVTYEGCYVVNPGRFLRRNEAHFMVYDAAKGVAVDKTLYV